MNCVIPKQNIKNIRRRIAASIKGLVLGDILGSRYEFIQRDSCDLDQVSDIENTLLSNNVFGHKGYTDDTIFTLLALDALSDPLHSLDTEFHKNFYRRYIDTPRDAYSPDGTVFDIGISTRKALIDNDFFQQEHESNSGNGVLMKQAPYAAYALWYCSANAIDDTTDFFTEITHGSYSTCRASRALTHQLINLWLTNPHDAFARNNDLPFLAEYEVTWEESKKLAFRGFCNDSLSFVTLTKDFGFEEVFRHAVVIGGDVDTNLAIAYQVYGAQLPETIEHYWDKYRKHIYNADLIERKVTKFLDIYFKENK